MQTVAVMQVHLVALAYCIGSIPFAYLLARRLRGIDVRRVGSGNVGAANVFRTTGAAGGLVVMVLDMAKGLTAVMLARRLDADPVGMAAAGLAAIVGHIYPVWIGFRGGKGVATACGVFAMLAPAATAGALLLFAGTLWWTRYVSVGSLVAAIALGPVAYFTHAPIPTVVGAILASVLIAARHRGNLSRLHAGTERRLGQKA